MTQHNIFGALFVLCVASASWPCLAEQQTYEVDRAEMDRALHNMNDTLSKTRAVPNVENGRPTGYQKVEVKPGSVYEKLGLQNGDVVKTVDGQQVNDPQRAFQLLNGEVKTNREIRVVRGGEEQAVSAEQPASQAENTSEESDRRYR